LDITKKFLRKANGRLMGEAQKGGVGDLIQLMADGLIDFGVPMTVEIGPNGGVAVEIPLPIGADEPRPLSRGD